MPKFSGRCRSSGVQKHDFLYRSCLFFFFLGGTGTDDIPAIRQRGTCKEERASLHGRCGPWGELCNAHHGRPFSHKDDGCILHWGLRRRDRCSIRDFPWAALCMGEELTNSSCEVVYSVSANAPWRRGKDAKWFRILKHPSVHRWKCKVCRESSSGTRRSLAPLLLI